MRIHEIERFIHHHKRKGYDERAIHNSLLEKGYSQEDIKQAMENVDRHPSWLDKSMFFHVAVIAAIVIIIISFPIIYIFSFGGNEDYKISEYSVIDTSTLEDFIFYFEASINTLDGSLYYNLLGPEQKLGACARWENLMESFPENTQSCEEEMNIFYHNEIRKSFFRDVSLDESLEHFSMVLVNTKEIDNILGLDIIAKGSSGTSRAFTVFIEMSGDDYRMASDFLLDSAFVD